MKVQATKLGYYDHKRMREGEVFELSPIKGLRNGEPKTYSPEEQFSDKWMEKVNDDDSFHVKKRGPKGSREPRVVSSDIDVI